MNKALSPTVLAIFTSGYFLGNLRSISRIENSAVGSVEKTVTKSNNNPPPFDVFHNPFRNIPVLDLNVLPVAKGGPNNQLIGLVWTLEFFRQHNLKVLDPVMMPRKFHVQMGPTLVSLTYFYPFADHSFDENHHEFDEKVFGDYKQHLSFDSLYEVGRNSNTFKALPLLEKKTNVDVVIIENSSFDLFEGYLERAEVLFENALIYRAPTSDAIFPFLTNGISNGIISPGSTVAIFKAAGGRRVLLSAQEPWLQNFSKDPVEPYLPVEWIRHNTMLQLEHMGLFAGGGGNFIAIHLRLWDDCFRPSYSDEFTLDLCCCGHKIHGLGTAGNSLERRLENFVKKKMKESDVSHALILGHPIINEICKNTSWIESSIKIWPTREYNQIHPVVTTIMQQYMMAMAKQVFVSTISSTIVTPVEIWRAYHDQPKVVSMSEELGLT